MGLLETINEKLKEAMKAKDENSLDSLRAIKSAVNYKKAETGKDPGDDEILQAIRKEAKKRKDSIEQFNAAGREDLARREEAQLAVIESFLPTEMGEEQIVSIARETIAQVGAVSKKEMGKVMGKLMSRLQGKADGARVKEIVMKLLD